MQSTERRRWREVVIGLFKANTVNEEDAGEERVSAPPLPCSRHCARSCGVKHAWKSCVCVCVCVSVCVCVCVCVCVTYMRVELPTQTLSAFINNNSIPCFVTFSNDPLPPLYTENEAWTRRTTCTQIPLRSLSLPCYPLPLRLSLPAADLRAAAS